jgi:hypothetical protein
VSISKQGVFSKYSFSDILIGNQNLALDVFCAMFSRFSRDKWVGTGIENFLGEGDSGTPAKGIFESSSGSLYGKSGRLGIFGRTHEDVDISLHGLYIHSNFLEQRCKAAVDSYNTHNVLGFTNNHANGLSTAETIPGRTCEEVLHALPTKYFVAEYDAAQSHIVEGCSWTERLDQAEQSQKFMEAVESTDSDKVRLSLLRAYLSLLRPW